MIVSMIGFVARCRRVWRAGSTLDSARFVPCGDKPLAVAHRNRVLVLGVARLDESRELVALLRGRWVIVSGHFVDDSAETCAVSSSDPELGRVPTAGQAGVRWRRATSSSSPWGSPRRGARRSTAACWLPPPARPAHPPASPRIGHGSPGRRRHRHRCPRPPSESRSCSPSHRRARRRRRAEPRRAAQAARDLRLPRRLRHRSGRRQEVPRGPEGAVSGVRTVSVRPIRNHRAADRPRAAGRLRARQAYDIVFPALNVASAPKHLQLQIAHRNAQGLWSIGHENAWAMIALNEAMLGFGDLNADFAFHAMLNGGPLASGDVSGNEVLASTNAQVPLEYISPTSPNLLTIQRDDGLGPRAPVVPVVHRREVNG